MAKPAKKSTTKKYTTPVFRLSFPHLFEASRNEDDPNSKAKFSCAAIWTPGTFKESEKPLWAAILKALNDESVKAFGKEWKKLDPSTHKKGLRNGAAKDGMDGYGEGTRFANLTTKHRPGVIDINKEKIGPEEGNAEEIYPGCYCRATVTVYSFGTKPGSKGKGVAIGLRNIQKVKDGPRLDNRVAAEDDFDEEVDSGWMDEADTDMDDTADDDAGGEDEFED